VTALVQPGGSQKDKASIEACNRHGLAMVFTGAAISSISICSIWTKREAGYC